MLVLTLIMQSAHAAEPAIFIKSGGNGITFTRSQLLSRSDLAAITITESAVFPGKTIVYKAVPVAALFKGVQLPDNATIMFHSQDDFSAPIDKSRLLNTSPSGAVAYIAIETPTEKWPLIKPDIDKTTTCGPFYLIWTNARKSRIGPEEWPMHFTGFSINEPLAKLFPRVMPSQKLAANDPIILGLKVFKTNCFACHMINRQGNGKVGPDLTAEEISAEHFSRAALRKFIRNPQSVRILPDDKMNGFPPSVITDEELDNLISYLIYMRERNLVK